MEQGTEQGTTGGVSRRGFLRLVMTAGLGLVATGAAQPGIAWADETGLSREGVRARLLIGSDLHVNNNTGAEPRDADKKLQFDFDTIYEIDPQLDAFCLVGDLTDNGSNDQYERLMALINDGGAHNAGYADGTGHTQMILCQGNHETYNWGVTLARSVFEDRTGQAANKVVDVNGVRVITMGPIGASDGDYRPNYDWFKQQLEEQGCDDGVPFLVLTHHQMRGSSYTSPEWHGNFGQGEANDFQKLMAQYPNLIQVSGHSHATLEDERSISQDLGFTAIQDSTIGAYYENETGKVDPDSGNGASVPPQTADVFTPGTSRQEASQVVLLDFMEDDTVRAYRISLVRSRAEGEGVVYLYEPWVIDPSDMTAYTTARESTAAPTWPAGAEVTVDEVTNTSAKVHFPAAQPGSERGDDMVHEYKLVAEAEDGSTVTKRIFGDYYRPAAYIRNSWAVAFKGLVADTTYTMSVYAQTSWNKEAGSEGSGTWTGSTEPAPNSTSPAIVSAAFTTGSAPVTPRAILDIDYREGVTEDAMGHTPNREQGMELVEDEEIGFKALEANGSTGWGYRLSATDYDQFVGASTHECYFKLVDNQTDQCLFSNQQSAGAGFEVENGKIEFWYNNDQARRILGTPVNTDEWVHAVATYDGTNVTLYVNGEQADQASAGKMTVPSPDRYYVCSDVSTSNMPEICAKAGTRVAFARLFPYAMTAEQVRTAYAARLLPPAPEKLLDVDFAAVERAAGIADAAGHEAVHPELAATAVIAYDEALGQNVFECDGRSAFGFAFDQDDYTYLGNEHALECIFMAHDLDSDQCFISNQQSSGDGLEIAGNSDTHGKMAFWFNSNGSGTPKPAGAVTADVWHHALGVYSCGKVRMYIDGRLCEEADAKGGLEVPPENCRNYYVGADVYTGGGAQLFTKPGTKIARAAILSKAPSEDEIKAIAAGFPLDPNAEPDTVTVSFAWAGSLAPEGAALPEDMTVEKGSSVTLPASPAKGETVKGEKDGVAGTWTFGGWDHEDGFLAEGNVIVSGTWAFVADEVIPAVDKTELQNKVDEAASLSQGDYTASSWAAFAAALSQANAVLANQSASEKDVSDALAALDAARNALVRNSGTGSGTGTGSGNGSGTGSGTGSTGGTGKRPSSGAGSGSAVPDTGDATSMIGSVVGALGALSLGGAGILSGISRRHASDDVIIYDEDDADLVD